MKLDKFPDSFRRKEKIVFYDKLLSQIPDLIFQMTITNNGIIKFPFLSESVISHFELTEAEIEQNTIEVLQKKIIPEDFNTFLDSIQKAKLNFETWFFDFRCNLPTKGLRWYRVNATIEKHGDDFVFYGRVSDNTENVKQELKLKISEERYEFALQATSEGIWDLNVATNQVFFSSQSMKMLGFEEKDAMLSIDKWDNRIHPDDIEKYQKDIKYHFENKTPFYKNLQRVLTNDGTYRWILSKGKVIERDSLGTPLRVIGMHSDISRQIEKEHELKRTLEILSEQNKRLLNFAHIVSHNLRSHAGNFKMLLDIIESETDQDIKDESLLYMRTNSNDLTETIENLKELVDIHSDLKPIREHLNLSQYLRKMINLLNDEFIKHKVDIQINIPDDATVYFNPAYLESILLNFSTNAVKYSHPERIPKIHYHLESANGVKVLSISDNGLGIDLEKNGDALFGMYKTFHRHPNSRGIGLFMSKNQIEAMGGRIKVESKVNVGSCFKIYFNEEL
ncbi:PAS domain S-box-containing protein [Flavobacterium arsenatis]|uniref:histidine kinase n=1 Tax=Flavobacterium arsenatis TaxID=1484332 RepID=A0ABU1TPP0_9FLAO|nr:PAS domain-containing sensor histidine kinase [Flavobacterium arsenatis]MDR6967940.1 PAS domain S-box-containing protein [Flavobacterium arsenatis]